ncbi:MAG: helix-hairpin-helix domain-containing protein [Deltaproteobacteria bacterium]|jgi:uncharacterized protein|nr:helix-hairpin-helix domain-containing protein [Deltaproteobacteria bacterium]
MDKFVRKVADELRLAPFQVSACFDLLIGEATVPFVGRYRKEATGGLDEAKINKLLQRLQIYGETQARREVVIKSLKCRKLLTDELRKALDDADSANVIEDVYLPYRPKRRTKAVLAREKGLAPLAEKILAQGEDDDPQRLAEEHLASEKASAGLTPGECLEGAKEIIAEIANEDRNARALLRHLYERKARVRTRVIPGKEELGHKFENYFEADEPVTRIPSHRYLAMRRGEIEGILTLSMRPEPEAALDVLRETYVKNDSPCAKLVEEAVWDGYERFLAPAMEAEIRLKSKRVADQEAINVFAKNLNELLMAAPWGKRPVMAIAPGVKNGGKMVALSASGDLLAYQTIFPYGSDYQRKVAKESVLYFLEKHNLTAIAVGNGTGGRETEIFLDNVPGIREKDIPVLMVSETAASIHGASEEAKNEFPQLDLSVRTAISIGRRLQDPLAELIKIEPRSIGVGQYQHDVDQLMLKSSLDNTVISCVNYVGVDANNASEKLLSYVSGLGPTLAKNIVKHREEFGPFRTKEDLLKVPRLGPKVFEQCAGFMRVYDGPNPLDRTAIHPESFPFVRLLAKSLGVREEELIGDFKLKTKIVLRDFVTDKVGIPTIKDILFQLARPGRDPRRILEPLNFAPEIKKPEDLAPGMRLPGIIVNVTAFGAFVDVGVHLDGLVHLSELADRYVTTPSEVVKVGQKVTVTVMSVNLTKGRISLSLRENPDKKIYAFPPHTHRLRKSEKELIPEAVN